MRNNLNPGPIIPSEHESPAYYARASTQAPSIKLVAAPQASAFASREEYLHFVTHKLNNKLWEDGRINMGIDPSGRVLANSVSPYSETFWDNVEPKLQPLVKALRDKRYLTYSSCEGHCLQSRRFVGIAFWSDQAREEFALKIESLGLFAVKCRRVDHVANMRTKESKTGEIEFTRSDKVTATDNNKKDEVDGFNISFHRKYDTYYFMELIIFDETPKVTGPISFAKALWLRWLKKNRWDATTEKITNFIRSKAIPTYTM